MQRDITPGRAPGYYGAPGSGRSAASKTALNLRQASGQQESSSHSRTGTNESGDLAKLVSNSDPLPAEYQNLPQSPPGFPVVTHPVAEKQPTAQSPPGYRQMIQSLNNNQNLAHSSTQCQNLTQSIVKGTATAREEDDVFGPDSHGFHSPVEQLLSSPSLAASSLFEQSKSTAPAVNPSILRSPLSGDPTPFPSHSGGSKLEQPESRGSGSVFPSAVLHQVAGGSYNRHVSSHMHSEVVQAEASSSASHVFQPSTLAIESSRFISQTGSSRGSRNTKRTLRPVLERSSLIQAPEQSSAHGVAQSQASAVESSLSSLSIKGHHHTQGAAQSSTPTLDAFRPFSQPPKAPRSMQELKGSESGPRDLRAHALPSHFHSHEMKVRQPYTGGEQPFRFPPGESRQNEAPLAEMQHSATHSSEMESSLHGSLSSSTVLDEPSFYSASASAEIKQEKDLSQSTDTLEASVVLDKNFRDDNNAAQRMIGMLQAQLDESKKRCERYKTERTSLRTALASNQTSLQEATAKVNGVEEDNRRLKETNRSLVAQLSSLHGQSVNHPASANTFSGTSTLSLSQQFAPASTIGHAATPYPRNVGPSNTLHSSLILPPRLQDSPMTSSMTLVPSLATANTSSSQEELQLRDLFHHLFKSAEEWSRTYANVPNHLADRSLPQSLTSLLVGATDPSLAVGLLSQADTRWTLVTRAIVQYLMNQVQEYTLLKDFHMEVDERVETCKARLHPRLAPSVRREILEEVAGVAAQMKAQPQYTAFLQQKLRSTSGGLLHPVGHFLALDSRGAEARLALDPIVREALTLGFLMYASPVEWVVEFPRLGAKFNSRSMVNRDPMIAGDPLELERRNIRVKLAITPTVIRRDVSGPVLMVSTLHLGHVLLMA